MYQDKGTNGDDTETFVYRCYCHFYSWDCLWPVPSLHNPKKFCDIDPLTLMNCTDCQGTFWSDCLYRNKLVQVSKGSHVSEKRSLQTVKTLWRIRISHLSSTPFVIILGFEFYLRPLTLQVSLETFWSCLWRPKTRPYILRPFNSEWDVLFMVLLVWLFSRWESLISLFTSVSRFTMRVLTSFRLWLFSVNWSRLWVFVFEDALVHGPILLDLILTS